MNNTKIETLNYLHSVIVYEIKAGMNNLKEVAADKYYDLGRLKDETPKIDPEFLAIDKDIETAILTDTSSYNKLKHSSNGIPTPRTEYFLNELAPWAHTHIKDGEYRLSKLHFIKALRLEFHLGLGAANRISELLLDRARLTISQKGEQNDVA